VPGLDRVAALAFTGRLSAATVALERFGAEEPERAQWLAGYIACARGAFDESLHLVRPLLVRTPSDRSVLVAALITAGSALRQLRRYEDARACDRRALRAARTSSERTHALIGLAADAVGAGAPSRCRAYLGRASDSIPRGDWRACIRLDWVRAEHALITGAPAEAVRRSRSALQKARGAGARRHEAKSLLFLGVALIDVGRTAEAMVPLRDSARIASRIGADYIAAIARSLLVDTRG